MHDFSRRDFLKISGAAFAGAWLPNPNKLPFTEKPSWKNNRFFENIETFKPEIMLPAIHSDLNSFTDQFNEPLKTAGLTLETWQKNLGFILNTLDRLKYLELTLKQLGEFDQHAREMLNQEFYRVASPIWAILRVNELFRSDPAKFKATINQPAINNQTNPADPFLGEEIFTLDAAWANTWLTSQSVDNNSPVFQIFQTSGENLRENCRSLFLSQKSFEPYPPGFQKAKDIPNRPAQVQVESKPKDEKLNQAFLKILADHRLDRAAAKLKIIPSSDEPSAGYINHEITVLMGNPTIESLQKYPHMWAVFIFHEFGHALTFLLPYLKSDLAVFRFQRIIHQVLTFFQPQKNLQKMFNPQGTLSPLSESNKTSLQANNQLATQVNEAALTNIPTQYLLGKEMFFAPFLQLLNDFDIFLKTPNLIYRFLPDAGNLSFEDYSKLLVKNIKEHQSEMTPLEKEIMTTIAANIDLFNAPKRTFFARNKTKPSHYFGRIVIPAVFLSLLNENPANLEKLVVNEFEPQHQTKIRHRFRQFILDTKLVETIIDNELFAEIFQSSIRRKDQGVKNEIPENIWQPIDRLFKLLIDNLINEGLARKTDNSFA